MGPNLIAIAGLSGSGKSEVANMIRYFSSVWYVKLGVSYQNWQTVPTGRYQLRPFAGPLKEIVSILTGIPREDLDKEEVKASVIPEEWRTYVLGRHSEGLNVTEFKNLPESQKQYYDCFHPTVREFLQYIGTDLLRNQLHPAAHINATFAKWTPESKWIIPDLRFPNEYEAVKARGGITIHVSRPSLDTSHPKYQHESETALEGFKFDHYLVNDGSIEDLLLKVKAICQ